MYILWKNSTKVNYRHFFTEFAKENHSIRSCQNKNVPDKNMCKKLFGPQSGSGIKLPSLFLMLFSVHWNNVQYAHFPCQEFWREIPFESKSMDYIFFMCESNMLHTVCMRIMRDGPSWYSVKKEYFDTQIVFINRPYHVIISKYA